MRKKLPNIAAIVLAVLMALGSVSNGLINFLKTPDKTQYLGIGSFFTGDYLNYLMEIAQGYRGFWQVFNLYTAEGTIGYWVVSWPYLLVGHIASLLKISPIFSYWLTVFTLTALSVYAAYFFLKLVLSKISKGHLIFPILITYLFSGPFLMPRQGPFRLEIWRVTWYYQADFFERTSVIIHHLLANYSLLIIFIISFYLFDLLKGKKYTLYSLLSWLEITIVLLLVMSIAPIKLVYILPAFVFGLVYSLFYHNFPRIKGLLFHLISFVVLVSLLFAFGLYFKKNVSVMFYPDVLFWERKMMQWPTLRNFFLLSGPLSVLAVPSIFVLLKDIIKRKIHPVLVFGLSASILSYILFYTKLSLVFNNHNSRFLFPDAYLFMAMAIFLAAEKIKLFQKKKNIIWLTVFLVCFSLPTFFLAVKQRVNGDQSAAVLQDRYPMYLPDEVVEGFSFLNTHENSDSLVLTTPFSDMGLIIPVFAQVRIYAAKELATIDYLIKARKSEDFFTSFMTKEQKVDFLRQENIDYIVFTVFDVVGMEDNLYKNPYFLSNDLPLKTVFSNSKITIYQVIR